MRLLCDTEDSGMVAWRPLPKELQTSQSNEFPMRTKRFILSGVIPAFSAALVFGALPAPARAQSASAPETEQPKIEFDIPAQPLPGALLAFSRASGVQVLYDSDLGSNQGAPLTSHAVAGLMTRDEALATLVEGLDLTPRYALPGAITLASLADRHTAVMVPLEKLEVEAGIVVGADQGFAAYARSAQNAFVQALQLNRRTARSQYNVAVSIWLSKDGAVERPLLRSSTGDEDLDRAIAEALSKVVLREAPPVDLPQPLNFGFHVRATH